jgi:hypothetical protein
VSFFKYANDPEIVKGNGRGRLQFGRADIDGMPFRGQSPYPMREDEFQQLTDVVCNTSCKIFDLSNHEQLVAYKEVLDRCVNKLYRCLFRSQRWAFDEKGIPHLYMYIEWTEPALETVRPINNLGPQGA